ncbi:MAG TPA: plasmid pRiA4b ORF-3 family protein [Candidatus Polarisedimenticolaceae bacterium]|nr:plasmid pRiA4b ORF-3 family protein [Candidatus Polarisedimenticolaceae bacterium]
MRRKRAAPPIILRLRVSLAEVEPPVWRRIELAYDASFWELHVAIQDAMGWKDVHPHVFRAPRPGSREIDEIGIPQDDAAGTAAPIAPGWETPIVAYLCRDGDAAEYVYDFDDDWIHDVIVEWSGPPEPKVSFPRCIAGSGACPSEDCGGPAAYRDWLARAGPAFDPRAFDPSARRFSNAAARLKRRLSRDR